MSLLAVEDIRVRYGRGRTSLTAVDGVSLALDGGASLGIVGESGSGKSTLARAIVQVVPTESGRITVDDREVTNATGTALKHVRDRVQMVFQDPFASLNPRMTIGATLREAIRLRQSGDGSEAGGTGDPRELLELVTLPAGLAHRYPNELSGGQLQRCCIARALAGKPRLLILDEVTSALDVSVQAAILNLLEDLRESFGLTYLCISHDLSVISYLCQRVIVMYLGQAVEVASWASLLQTPQHPYTQTLLDSVPQVHGEIMRATARGDIPDPRRPPSGCRFHTRCPIGPLAHPERTACVTADPHADAAAGNGQYVACHFPLGNADRAIVTPASNGEGSHD
jgi:peptide/nickel transport system ATP-binding protein